MKYIKLIQTLNILGKQRGEQTLWSVKIRLFCQVSGNCHWIYEFWLRNFFIISKQFIPPIFIPRLPSALHWNLGQDRFIGRVLQNIRWVECLKDWYCLLPQSGHDHKRFPHFQLRIIPGISRRNPGTLARAGNIAASWQYHSNFQRHALPQKRN